MKALVLEDDELVGELIESIVAGLGGVQQVTLARSLTEAKRCVAGDAFGLYLVDWELPDGSGLELVKQIRRSDSVVPVVIISGRSDRESVIKAAHHGISGYITKPLDVELLHQRLTDLIPAPTVESASVHEFMAKASNSVVQLPTELDPAEIIELIGRADTLSASELAERWREQIGLTARILDVANSSSFRRTGKPVESLRVAIGSIGVSMALNQALALALDVTAKLTRPELKAVADRYQDISLRVSRDANQIALRVGKASTMYRSAGLLSRLGEMAVLKVLNQFDAAGGTLAEAEIEQCLARWSEEYGNRLKVHWKFPLGLRELIGAVHFLSPDNHREGPIIMRAAALMAESRQEEKECQRLLRQLGLDATELTKETPSDAV
ncbi:response regulator [Marinobacter sp. S0848L]|uniref:response regulator n=1 Tax=Marinobacter sp. S0848L TaxID=2926423 RepID=UPI001FF34B34|nr:response regulator [Marinobacter sp. S0848L]MCK0105802.1 response regulator [Marinobacter sp. S0848L]